MTAKPTITNLVLGSEGFVGKPFCSYLEQQGEEVVRFDIKRDDREDARSVSLSLDGVDRVYFLAWEVGGAKYLYRDDVQFLQLDWNLQLLLNVMPQLRESKTPFLFVSSQLAEEHDTVYGVTKRLGEVWTRLLQGVRVRLWNVYGSYEDQTERSHVVADFVHQALETGRIEMMTSGEEVRQFIHVDDVCSAFHSALSQKLEGLYDVSSFEWASVRNLAQIIADLTDAEVVPGTRTGLTPLTPMVGKIPDWEPSLTLRNGLSKMIDLYRQHR